MKKNQQSLLIFVVVSEKVRYNHLINNAALLSATTLEHQMQTITDAITQSVATNSIVAFTFAGDMATLLAELDSLGCVECDDDGDTVWGLDSDGDEFRLRPEFSA